MTPDKYLLKDILLTLQELLREAREQTEALKYLVQEAKEMEDQ
tara:strand:- start:7 stop:135 length:129 start_codon:yes stop_codon:yes gene_type:complete